ncbi:hypothetical protein ANN_11990 [Periplaneta americana]|uniref:Uncharacterized protein n=1 Tax=Periplaneta americana TaxID=6978 RepID=A0ABQ8T6L5_PERAM|nr:hypothetical protein ANN_11990 [Periplaneta americana]
MADTSEYTSEEHLVDFVWVHERQVNGKSMKNVMDDFVARFEKAAPTRKTLLLWEKKAFTTGNAQRNGRPSTKLQRWHNLSNNPHENVLLSGDYQNQPCGNTIWKWT